MSDPLDDLMVTVRADTAAFAADMQRMKTSFDGALLDGFERAGGILEKSLLTAVRSGSLGFDDLKRSALAALDQIAARALQMGLDSLFGGAGSAGGLGGLLGGTLGALLGLPGRATGGLVAPQTPYLVGERGPELFVPTSAGRIDTAASLASRGQRDVRVAVNLTAPRGSDTPAVLQRSSRQLAAAVRRALVN